MNLSAYWLFAGISFQLGIFLQVCPSAEDYRGYDGELGLCVCREAPGRAACGGLCRSRPPAELHLQCRADGAMELVWSYDSKVRKGKYTYVAFSGKDSGNKA